MKIGKIVRKFLLRIKKLSEKEKMMELKRFSFFKQSTSLSYYGRRYRKYKAEGLCRVCNKVAHVKHHIIQLQHGGHDIWWNRLDICNACHAEIHPWLKDPSLRNRFENEKKLIPYVVEPIRDLDKEYLVVVK